MLRRLVAVIEVVCRGIVRRAGHQLAEQDRLQIAKPLEAQAAGAGQGDDGRPGLDQAGQDIDAVEVLLDIEGFQLLRGDGRRGECEEQGAGARDEAYGHSGELETVTDNVPLAVAPVVSWMV